MTFTDALKRLIGRHLYSQEIELAMNANKNGEGYFQGLNNLPFRPGMSTHRVLGKYIVIDDVTYTIAAGALQEKERGTRVCTLDGRLIVEDKIVYHPKKSDAAERVMTKYDPPGAFFGKTSKTPVADE